MEHAGKTRIGLITAVAAEGGFPAAPGGKAREERSGNLLFSLSKWSGLPLIHTASGIGKTNAAHAATVMIGRYSPSVLISFGIGGAYPSSGLGIGDIAVASREIYADEGVLTMNGFETARAIGIPLLKGKGRPYFNEFPADRSLGRRALRAARRVAAAVSGPFATVSTCSGTKDRALEIEKSFGAICENMEGAAVAHVGRIYGIHFAEIRGISNIVEDRDLSRWDIATAAEKCQMAVEAFLDDLAGRR